ncbi:MAG: glycosyltransferase family 2 protein [Deltaproteobacteria bacterium]|nr:glycosyltransferase family 2 protein [Deltaproteobacteria bacterium]
MSVINYLSYILLFFIGLPITVLAVETFAAIVLCNKIRPPADKTPRITIIIPAHDEEAVIASTIVSILPQLAQTDSILVVADNCSDATASVALNLGTDVIERHDTDFTGKGYALDYGISSLKSDPPDIIVFMDADVIATPDSLKKISQLAFQTGLPIQAAYLLKPPEGAGTKSQLSAFAFCFKNYIRPSGLFKLGLPCLLTGTGMAIPWAVIQEVSLANGNIVEDMQLGIDLTLAGHSPLFCPDARIIGELPAASDTAVIQRKRWEYGHLKTIFSQVPRLLRHSIRFKRIDLLGLSMELMIPPLSILFFLWSIAMAILTSLSLLNLVIWAPAIVSAGLGALLALTILLGWLNFGRDILSFETLLKTPCYLFSKVPIYFSFIKNPEKRWIKTKREKAGLNSENKKTDNTFIK